MFSQHDLEQKLHCNDEALAFNKKTQFTIYFLLVVRENVVLHRQGNPQCVCVCVCGLILQMVEVALG